MATKYPTAREAYKALRLYWHENSESFDTPTGGYSCLSRLYRHCGVVRRGGQFDPHRGVERGFSELFVAAHYGAAYARGVGRDDAKRSIAWLINQARACAAPVLP